MDKRDDALLPHHRAALESASGISSEVIEQRGYHSLRADQFLMLCEQKKYDHSLVAAGGWMAIPIHRPDGSQYGEMIRLDSELDGHPGQKYIWPSGEPNVVDIHPYCQLQGWHHDTSIPLTVCEGIKKADAVLSYAIKQGLKICVVAINGCWGWRGRVKGSDGKGLPLADWMDIALDGREILIIPDSDYRTNLNVAQAYNDFYRYLQSKTKDHKVAVCCPPGRGLSKQGADDYLLAHTLDELLGLAVHPKMLDEEPAAQSFEFLKPSQLIARWKDKMKWVVENMLPAGQLGILVGHSGALKTWNMHVAAADIAAGKPQAFGHPDMRITGTRRVLLVSCELHGGILAERHEALMASGRYTAEDLERIEENLVILSDQSMDIGDQASQELLASYIQALKIEVTITDSLSMAWGGNENDNGDVKALYLGVRKNIIEPTGTAFWFIHHLAKPQRADTTNARPEIERKFDVRGAGQLVQQASVVWRIDNYAKLDGGSQQMQWSCLKSWASIEPRPFINEFLVDPTSHAITLQFHAMLEDMLAHTLAGALDDTEAGTRWLLEALAAQPGMSANGLTRGAVAHVVTNRWPHAEAGKPPDERKVALWLRELRDREDIWQGTLVGSEQELYALPGAPVALAANAINAPIVDGGDDGA